MFPSLQNERIVKVRDNRFRRGFYLGRIKDNFPATWEAFEVYLVLRLENEKPFWVYRDRMEVFE